MYKVLILSKEGSGLGVGQRMALEGCDVSVWSPEERTKYAGAGLVDRVTDWEKIAPSQDFIITDTVGLGNLEQKLRALGVPLLGCSAALDKIELDRALGMRLFDFAGIVVPETYPFEGTADADKIIKELPWQNGWVLKPSGNLSTSKTLVVKDQENWASCLSELSPDCNGIVQRALDGIEVSTEGWFNGSEFVAPMNHTFEEKRFMAGGLGVNTGCMGNVVIAAEKRGDALTAATVARLAGFLKQISYRGPLDINCIVNEDGAFALEATSRLGYDAIEALAEGLEVPLSDFLYDIACGTAKTCPVTDQTMIAVRLSVPPWPMRKPNQEEAKGKLIKGIDDTTLPHLFLTDVYKDDEGYKTAGSDGILLKATAKGMPRFNDEALPQTDYTSTARRRVYAILDKIKISGKQYRIDIGERVNAEVAQLQKWGWL